MQSQRSPSMEVSLLVFTARGLVAPGNAVCWTLVGYGLGRIRVKINAYAVISLPDPWGHE